MKYLFILSCLFAACLVATYGQFSSSTSKTTGQQRATTGSPSRSTASSAISCVCSCCSGLRCKPVILRSFADSTCTTKACKDKCKVFEPKHCDHTFMGTNDAYCAV